MALLTALTTTLAGKAAAATAGLALTGAGLTVAIDVAPEAADEGLETAQEQVDAEVPDDLDVPALPALPDLAELPDLPDAAANVPEIVPVTPTDVEETPDEQRSERADAVHEALAGEVSPGNEDFGQTVAENAREGGEAFGRSVADAARNGAGEGDDGEANGVVGLEQANEVAAVDVPVSDAPPTPEVPAPDVELPVDPAAGADNAADGLAEAEGAPSPRGPRD